MAKSREQTESDIQNMLAVLQTTREQLEQLRTQAELLRISLEEHRTAIDTLEAYKDVQSGQEVLVPVGANAFVFAQSAGSKVAVTELGAGVSASVPIEAAVEKLRKRIERIEASRKKMVDGGTRLESNAAALEEQIQNTYAELSAGPSARGQAAKAGHAHPHDEED